MEALLATLLPQFIAAIPSIIAAAPAVINAWSSTATSSGTAKVQAIVATLPPQTVSVLTQMGASDFPQLAPEFHAAAALFSITNPSATQFVQEALNYAAEKAYIVYPKTKGFPLDLDGIYGTHTKAAIMLLQTKAGYPVTGFVADAESTLLGGLLAKIG